MGLWPCLIVLGLALSACGGDAAVGAEAEPTESPDLSGREFVASEVTGHDLVPGSEIRMAFLTDRVSVQAGCNTLTGGATWDAGVLNVAQPMASTMMACPDELSDQDAWLSDFLSSAPRLRLDGTTLTLGDDSAGMVLTERQGQQ